MAGKAFLGVILALGAAAIVKLSCDDSRWRCYYCRLSLWGETEDVEVTSGFGEVLGWAHRQCWIDANTHTLPGVRGAGTAEDAEIAE